MGDSKAKEHHAIYYSEKEQKIYWVDTDNNTVIKSWPCHGLEGKLEGKTEQEDKYKSLPVGDYNLCAGKLSPKKDLDGSLPVGDDNLCDGKITPKKDHKTKVGEAELEALGALGDMGEIANQALKFTKDILQARVQTKDVHFKMEDKDREDLDSLVTKDGGNISVTAQKGPLNLQQKNVSQQTPTSDQTQLNSDVPKSQQDNTTENQSIAHAVSQWINGAVAQQEALGELIKQIREAERDRDPGMPR